MTKPKRKSNKASGDRINQILRNQIAILNYLRLQCCDNFIGNLSRDTFGKLIDESVPLIKVREVKR